MSNVLPEHVQRKVWRSYEDRMIASASLVAIALAVMTALALVPGYFAVGIASSTYGPELPGLSPKDAADRRELTQAQAKLAQIAPIVTATTTPTDAISAALALRPQGLAVERISYATVPATTIVIAGTAQRRESISAYRDALSRSPVFSSVNVPVGDLVGTAGGRFTITLTGAF